MANKIREVSHKDVMSMLPGYLKQKDIEIPVVNPEASLGVTLKVLDNSYVLKDRMTISNPVDFLYGQMVDSKPFMVVNGGIDNLINDTLKTLEVSSLSELGVKMNSIESQLPKLSNPNKTHKVTLYIPSSN